MAQNPMNNKLIERQKAVKDAIRGFVRNLMEPCHTSAYVAGHRLDGLISELLSYDSGSDYGHSSFLVDAFAHAVTEVMWNDKNYITTRNIGEQNVSTND